MCLCVLWIEIVIRIKSYGFGKHHRHRSKTIPATVSSERNFNWWMHLSRKVQPLIATNFHSIHQKTLSHYQLVQHDWEWWLLMLASITSSRVVINPFVGFLSYEKKKKTKPKIINKQKVRRQSTPKRTEW